MALYIGKGQKVKIATNNGAFHVKQIPRYTITFYDVDGDTVLYTEQVIYGGSSSYSPDPKESYTFAGWNPQPVNVTSDLKCYGIWEEIISFATASWERIAQISESGQASQVFSVGDTRTETIDGSNFTLEIIGFNHDTITDTGELAGITVWIKDFNKVKVPNFMSCPWDNNLHKNHEVPIFDLLSSELQSVIKSVTKEYIKAYSEYSKRTCTAKIWSLSAEEIDLETGKSNVREGKTYEKFANYPDKKYNNSAYTYPDIKTNKRYWLRSFHFSGGAMYVSASGSLGQGSNYLTQSYVCPCFCI